MIKDILGLQALETIADAGVAVSPSFDRNVFLSTARSELETLSIMERVRHIADALKVALPTDYATALKTIRAIAPRLTHGFQAVALSEYVARHGLTDYERSMEALAYLTRFGSAEFAVRPFLALDLERTLAVMKCWSHSEDEHVRRLASEGSRPRLPWASRVPGLKNDPTLAVSILDGLKTDPSAYVRKSVANHLNDIAKDRPEWLLDHLADWPKSDTRTAWIIRHALRTLIKKGDPQALAILGVGYGADVEVRRFSVEPQTLHLGDTITINADLVSTSAKTQRLVVDYVIHYVRLGGKSSRKVFKLKTFDFAASATTALGIRQPIRDFSTRRHYPGHHDVELIVNGHSMASSSFELLPFSPG